MSESRPKEKYFDGQFDDEEVLFVFRKHPVVMRKGLIFSCVLLLLGPLYTVLLTFIDKNNPPSVAFLFGSLIVSLAISLVAFTPFWIGWYFSVFIVTDQRFIQITQKGLFHRSVVDIGLQQLQQVNYAIEGFQATLLGFGTITIQTYVGELVIHDVHHPAKIQQKIVEILRDQGLNTNVFPVGKQAVEQNEIIEKA